MLEKSAYLMKKVRLRYIYVLLGIFAIYLVIRIIPSYAFLADYRIFFVIGLRNSFILAFGSIGLGFLVGLLTALADVYGGKPGSISTTIYAEFFRGSPLVVQCFLFYYTIPSILPAFQFDRLTTALLCFTLNTGAYQKGYIKGAIESVYEDQLMAARSLGMTRIQVIRHIVLPQSLRVLIPSWSNEYSAMTKSTSAAIAIGVPELTTMASSVAFQTFENFKTYTFTALIYFIWIYLSLKVLEFIYERMKVPGFEA